eukprot:SAG22_NODE_17799_length_298_cov_0.783920_1_plen_57_part_10
MAQFNSADRAPAEAPPLRGPMADTDEPAPEQPAPAPDPAPAPSWVPFAAANADCAVD